MFKGELNDRNNDLLNLAEYFGGAVDRCENLGGHNLSELEIQRRYKETHSADSLGNAHSGKGLVVITLDHDGLQVRW